MIVKREWVMFFRVCNFESIAGVMNRWILLSALLCFAAGSVRAQQKGEYLLDGVAAVVNEHVVTVGDIMSSIDPLRHRLASAGSSADQKKEVRALYESALESLVEKFLILDSEESSRIQIPEWYVDRRVDEIIKESFAGDRTRFMNILARDRQTFEQWRSELKDHIVISSVRGMKIDSNVSVSPSEVLAFYKKEKGRFVVPSRIKVSMIVLDKAQKADDPAALAEMLKKRIEKGEDFAGLARKYSSGTYAQNGGDWGWIEPDILRKDIREAADAMEVGEVGVVEGKGEVYIFRVEDRKDAVKKEFADVQPLVERELKRQKASAEAKAWIELLKKSAYIKINDVSLD